MYKLKTRFEITYNLGNNTARQQYDIAGSNIEEILPKFRQYIFAIEGLHPHILCVRDTAQGIYIEA